MAFLIRDLDLCCHRPTCVSWLSRIWTLGKFTMVLSVFLCLFEATRCYRSAETATWIKMFYPEPCFTCHLCISTPWKFRDLVAILSSEVFSPSVQKTSVSHWILRAAHSNPRGNWNWLHPTCAPQNLPHRDVVRLKERRRTFANACQEYFSHLFIQWPRWWHPAYCKLENSILFSRCWTVEQKQSPEMCWMLYCCCHNKVSHSISYHQALGTPKLSSSVYNLPCYQCKAASTGSLNTT